MVQEIHLYIDKKEVFFSEPPEILFTFQRVDYTNPSIIKNNFTKTISIDGVQENNVLFNEIWKLDRTQGEEIFNPSKRVPFELYQNGGLLETGYAKLDNIIREGYKITYEVTLYGGLGDFFYGLSYGFDYDRFDEAVEQSKDEELKLKDLTFLEESETDDPAELNFSITKESVLEAWETLGNETHQQNKWDIVNFAPTYNGNADDFDNDKVLVNTFGYSNGIRLSVPAGSIVNGITYDTDQVVELSVFPQTIVYEGKSYTAQNGYGLSELREPLNEWEIRDLRSYLQRPVLSVKSLFEAIKRYAKEKGGYTLDLSDEFFSDDNHYYSKAWITLPTLQNLNGEYAEQDANGALDVGLSENTRIDAGKKGDYFYKQLNTVINLTKTVPSSQLKSASVEFKLYVATNSALSPLVLNKYQSTSGFQYKSVYQVRLVGYNDNGQVVKYGEKHLFGNDASGSYIRHYGKFVYDTDLGKHLFIDDRGNDTFILTLDYEDKIFSKIGIEITKDISYNTAASSWLSEDMSYRAIFYENTATLGYVETNNVGIIINNSNVIFKIDNNVMKSYQLITKGKLLGQEGTPAKYMIDYCKLFNLYFDKDPIDKVVTIKQRKNFYENTVVDLENKIDRSKPINIRPIAFDAKWYDFNYTEGDKSEFADKYYRNWGTDYGKQKVNTGYNFDNSSNNLLEGNLFNNGIEALEMSKYYQAKIKNNVILPNWLQEWSEFKLFHQSAEGSGVESSDNFYIGLPNGTTAIPYNVYDLKYDGMSKLQLHSEDNESIDGSNILVFFNGMRYTNAQGRNLNYFITDDRPEMYDLNGKSCWLSTMGTTDRNGNVIAAQLKKNYAPVLPHFVRMERSGNVITNTFDFGRANELYVPNITYNEGSNTIYDKYWGKYIADLYDRTTRVVTCYVKLDGKVEGDWLKKFYYFDNSIWCLTKIEDYNITSFGTTKCEFAKVKDINNYR